MKAGDAVGLVYLKVYILDIFIFLLLLVVVVFRDRVSLCSPDCPGTHSVDQGGLELIDLPTSAS